MSIIIYYIILYGGGGGGGWWWCCCSVIKKLDFIAPKINVKWVCGKKGGKRRQPHFLSSSPNEKKPWEKPWEERDLVYIVGTTRSAARAWTRGKKKSIRTEEKAKKLVALESQEAQKEELFLCDRIYEIRIMGWTHTADIPTEKTRQQQKSPHTTSFLSLISFTLRILYTYIYTYIHTYRKSNTNQTYVYSSRHTQ